MAILNVSIKDNEKKRIQSYAKENDMNFSASVRQLIDLGFQLEELKKMQTKKEEDGKPNNTEIEAETIITLKKILAISLKTFYCVYDSDSEKNDISDKVKEKDKAYILASDRAEKFLKTGKYDPKFASQSAESDQ